jgi:hypothetical protein
MMSKGLKVSDDAGFKGFMDVHDLNFNLRKSWSTCHGRRLAASSIAKAATSVYERSAAPVFFRVMAFSQLTWRESLRDIEVCLTANQAKLFHMGIKGVPTYSTLSDARNIDLDATVYALVATTIDLCLCLCLFDWAPST